MCFCDETKGKLPIKIMLIVIDINYFHQGVALTLFGLFLQREKSIFFPSWLLIAIFRNMWTLPKFLCMLSVIIMAQPTNLKKQKQTKLDWNLPVSY